MTAATGQLEDLLGAELTCTGSTSDVQFWGSDPATRVDHVSGGWVGCAVGTHGFLGIDVVEGDAYGYVVVEDDTGAPVLSAAGTLELTEDRVRGHLPVGAGSGQPGDSVGVELAIGPVLETGKHWYREGGWACFQRYSESALTGLVTTPDGTEHHVDRSLVGTRTMTRDSMKVPD